MFIGVLDICCQQLYAVLVNLYLCICALNTLSGFNRNIIFDFLEPKICGLLVIYTTFLIF